MAALRMTLVAVFAWARRSCVPRAKREDSRKIPLGRRTKVSTHLEAENIKVKNRRWIDGSARIARIKRIFPPRAFLDRKSLSRSDHQYSLGPRRTSESSKARYRRINGQSRWLGYYISLATFISRYIRYNCSPGNIRPVERRLTLIGFGMECLRQPTTSAG